MCGQEGGVVKRERDKVQLVDDVRALPWEGGDACATASFRGKKW